MGGDIGKHVTLNRKGPPSAPVSLDSDTVPFKVGSYVMGQET